MLDLDLIGSRVRIDAEDALFLHGLEYCFERAEARGAEGADLEVEVRAAVGGRAAPNGGTTDHELELRGALDPTATFPSRVASALDLCSSLNRWAVAADRAHCIFHAGAVSRDGRAVLLPAGSHSGKSTITAGLVRRGLALHSDEVGAVEMDSGMVLPYPRSLCLRDDVLTPLGIGKGIGYAFPERCVRVVRPEELGGARALRPAALALVVSPRYVRNAPARLERLSTGEAIIALMESSCSQARLKTAGLDWVISLARRLPCYRIEFTDLDDALDSILAELDRIAGDGA